MPVVLTRAVAEAAIALVTAALVGAALVAAGGAGEFLKREGKKRQSIDGLTSIDKLNSDTSCSTSFALFQALSQCVTRR